MNESRAEYMRNYRNKLKAEAKPLLGTPVELNEPDDFPFHRCIQVINEGTPEAKRIYVEDPNYAKMCQYVYCRKPATGTTRVYMDDLRVCDKHKAMVEWIDPNAPKLKPADVLDDSVMPWDIK